MKILAVGLAVFLGLFTVPSWLNVVSHHRTQNGPPVDFTVFYLAGQLIRENPTTLYDFDRQKALQASIATTTHPKQVLFYYPPMVAFLFAPLSFLPFSAAYILMTAINLLCLWAALWLLIRHLQLDRDRATWLILFAACNYGLWVGLLMGQLSFLLLLILTTYLCTKYAGVAVGLLCLKPSLFPIPLAVLAFQRRWWNLSLGLSVIAVLGAISLAVIGIDEAWSYFTISSRLASDNNYLSVDYERQNSIRAAIYYFAAPEWRNQLWWVVVFVAVGLLAFRLRRERAMAIDVLLTCVIVAPHLHDHDLTALLILVVAFWLKSLERLTPLGTSALLAVAIMPLVIVSAGLPPLMPLILIAFWAYWAIPTYRSESALPAALPGRLPESHT